MLHQRAAITYIDNADRSDRQKEKLDYYSTSCNENNLGLSDVIPTTKKEEELHNPSILAVDDEYDIVNLIKRSLEIDGFEVFSFTDALAALDYLKSNSKSCDIVVSDIRMPAINGYEFVKQVKNFKRSTDSINAIGYSLVISLSYIVHIIIINCCILC
jgi:CheY-like chemotaxis protein